MSLRRSVAPSLRATHPALFLVGFAVVALQSALSFALAAVEAPLSPVYSPLFALGGPLVVAVLTLPLAVGLYEPIREGTDGARETLRAAVRAIRRRYWTVLAANLTALAVAAGVALAGTALAFVLGTALRYAQYATGDPGQPVAVLTVWGFPILFAVFLAAGLPVTRFADVFATYEGEGPRAAWRPSAVFARRKPLSFLGYALATVVLLGTAQTLQYAFAQVDDVASLAAGIGAILAVGTVGFTLASALHVTYFERTVAPAVQAVPRVTTRWTRLAAVAVVLLAAVAGAGYVRAVDAGAGQAELQELPDDHEAAYAVAATNTREANHRRTVLARNATEPDSEWRKTSESAIDYDDRRASIFFYGEDPDVRVGSYHGEGTIAMPSGGGSWRGTFGPVTRERNDWTVIAMPGYAVSDPTDVAPVPKRGAAWSVAHSNASVLVYQSTTADDIRTAFSTSYAGMNGELANDSYLRVVVDRERGVVDTVRIRAHSLDSGNAYEYEMRYGAGETVDVERPEAIGSRSPLEWAWDVLYY
ncbi:hypothetical protein SAMN05216559_2792 [Halomicrobium zhouii]|uniref:DUF7847 domain-containing protein n=1 Tax=Halomicrobium zhouii TaxID=767519 RepID=A0A1I6LJJ9_9EURY|nr:hypothetical protein [Halomicrobium zhouii]SFS03492.1 hypothetical protein SAMN05216559_2792 [Halomicrobium zhouii]